jgi:hypothetical protein
MWSTAQYHRLEQQLWHSSPTFRWHLPTRLCHRTHEPEPGCLTGTGILTVYFQYSCGSEGHVSASQDSWKEVDPPLTSFSTETIEPHFGFSPPPRSRY